MAIAKLVKSKKWGSYTFIIIWTVLAVLIVLLEFACPHFLARVYGLSEKYAFSIFIGFAACCLILNLILIYGMFTETITLVLVWIMAHAVMFLTQTIHFIITSISKASKYEESKVVMISRNGFIVVIQIFWLASICQIVRYWWRLDKTSDNKSRQRESGRRRRIGILERLRGNRRVSVNVEQNQIENT